MKTMFLNTLRQIYELFKVLDSVCDCNYDVIGPYTVLRHVCQSN